MNLNPMPPDIPVQLMNFSAVWVPISERKIPVSEEPGPAFYVIFTLLCAAFVFSLSMYVYHSIKLYRLRKEIKKSEQRIAELNAVAFAARAKYQEIQEIREQIKAGNTALGQVAIEAMDKNMETDEFLAYVRDKKWPSQ